VHVVEPRRLLAGSRFLGLLGGALLLAVVAVGGIGLWGILPAFFLVVASMGATWPNTIMLALADHPQSAGAGAAAMGGSFFLVGALVAPLVGVGGKHTALPLALVIAVFETLALAALLIPRETKTRSL
jgi:MFS transporter, DHA1 family, multidrug resistance protein